MDRTPRCRAAGLVARSVALRLAATLVCAGWADSVTAQVDDTVDASAYEATVEEALQEYERGRWEEAAVLFRRAHAQNPSARTLRGLGLAVYEARHYPDAIHFLSEALTDTRRPLTDKQREEVSTTIERAKLFVGYLALSVEPEAAKVLINGQPIERDEHGQIVTEIGWLDIEISAPEYKTSLRRMHVNAGDKQQLVVLLEPEQASTLRADAPPGSLTVQTAGDPQTTPNSSALGTWKWVAAGAALAGLGTGAAMLFVQKSGAPDYDKQCVQNPPQADCAQRNQLLGSTLWNGSIVGFTLGAAFSALTVTLFVLDAEPQERAAKASLSCATHPLGLTCQGRF